MVFVVDLTESNINITHYHKGHLQEDSLVVANTNTSVSLQIVVNKGIWDNISRCETVRGHKIRLNKL